MLAQIKKSIAAIHAAPLGVVLELAGAGSRALAWLHAVGGSSRTVLEAADRYAPRALREALGFKPPQAVSETVAVALAERARARAVALAEPGTPVAGLGCTAAIATARAKRGSHRAYVALRAQWETHTYALSLRQGRRSRDQEEELVSLLIVRALARACGVKDVPELALLEGERLVVNVEDHDPLPRLVRGQVRWASVSPQGRLATGQVKRGLALLPGAFNPLHPGHLGLARVASRLTGREVFFELSMRNADKQDLAPPEARLRALQFAGRAPLLLTVAPLFCQKAEVFPDSVFVVGADTAARLVQPRFYRDDPAGVQAALLAIRAAGCRFLVAGRELGGEFRTLRELEIPAAFSALFEEIPPEAFRVDLSSTELRRGRA